MLIATLMNIVLVITPASGGTHAEYVAMCDAFQRAAPEGVTSLICVHPSYTVRPRARQ